MSPVITAILVASLQGQVSDASDRVAMVHRSYLAWTAASDIGHHDVPWSTRVRWSIWTTEAVFRYGSVRGKLIIDPSLVAAIAKRESGLDPDAVLPGCPRRGKRPKHCNTDGRADVGLCQLRTKRSWSWVTPETARDPRTNIIECVRQLRVHYLAHRSRGCERAHWAERWPKRGPWANHNWLQHHNPGSRTHGTKVMRLWRAVRRRVRSHQHTREQVNQT